jgi:PAS domain S-box-containing protein
MQQDNWTRQQNNMSEFLDRVITTLFASLDIEQTLHSVCHLLVPSLTDWCSVSLLEKDDYTVKSVAIAHRDPALEKAAYEIGSYYKVNIDTPLPSIEPLRTGNPKILSEIPQQLKDAITDPVAQDLIRRLDPKSAMYIPLTVHNRNIGVLSLNITGENPRRFSEADLPLAKALGKRVAIAIDNAQLYHQTQEARQAAERYAEREHHLQVITSALSNLIDVQSVAKVLVHQSLAALPAAHAGLLALVVEDGAWVEIQYASGYNDTSMNNWRRMSATDMTLPIVYGIAQGTPLFLKSRDEWKALSPENPDLMTSASLALVPLVINDTVIGSLVLSFDQPQEFTPEARSFLANVAQQGAHAIERSRLYESESKARAQAESRQRQLQFLAQASELLASSLDYETTLEHTAQLAVPMVADWCVIDLVEKDGSLREVTVYHPDSEKAAAVKRLRAKFRPDESRPNAARMVAQSGKPILIPKISWEDIAKGANISDEDTLELLRSIDIKSLLYVPLKSWRGVLGVISLTLNESNRYYSQDDVTMAEELARRASNAIENSVLYREVVEQRERLGTSLNSIGDALIATDEQGRITLMNPVAQELTGWPLADAAGKDIGEIFNIINESSRKEVESPVTRVLREGIIVGLANHTLLITRDGREVPIDDSGAPIRDEAGKIIGVILVFRDITERTRLEKDREALTRQMRSAARQAIRLQEITAALSSAITVTDIATIVINLTRETLGADSATLIQRINDTTLRMIEAVHSVANIKEQWQEFSIDADMPMSKAVKEAIPLWIESVQEWHDNYSMPINVVNQAWATLPLIVKNKAIGAIGMAFAEPHHFSDDEKQFMLTLAGQCAQALDRTLLYEAERAARREAEQAQHRLSFLAKASQLLGSSLDYDATFKNLKALILPDLADIYTIDVQREDDTMARVALGATSPEVEELVREIDRRFPPDMKAIIASPQYQSGEPILFAEITPNFIAATVPNEEHRALLTTLNATTEILIPLHIRDRSIGIITVLRCGNKPHYNEQDTLLIQELSYRAAQAIENAQLYAQSRQAVRLRDEFLSVAAHELKTPITSMRGFAQSLLRQLSKRGTFDQERVQHGLQVIETQSVKLSKLVSQLLDISRIEAGRLTLERQDCDLVPVLQSVVSQLQKDTDNHTITLTSPDAHLLWIDPLRIEQVVINLVDNAIKYSPDGGKIDLSLLVADNQKTHLSVRDYGIGIPKPHRAHLFNRFYQAHGEGHLGGMGLGLFICKQIVELHGGQIEAQFPDDGGTRFIITLP